MDIHEVFFPNGLQALGEIGGRKRPRRARPEGGQSILEFFYPTLEVSKVPFLACFGSLKHCLDNLGRLKSYCQRTSSLETG